MLQYWKNSISNYTGSRLQLPWQPYQFRLRLPSPRPAQDVLKVSDGANTKMQKRDRLSVPSVTLLSAIIYFASNWQ